MASGIVDYLIRADKVSDYIPVVSTVTSLFDLFQKCVILPRMKVQRVENSHYYTHIDQKSFLRCAVLLIPFLGNFFVGVYDFINRKYDDKDFMLHSIADSMGTTIKKASLRLRNDPDFMFEAQMIQNACFQNTKLKIPMHTDELIAMLVLSFASNRLKNNSDFMSRFYNYGGNGFGLALEHLVGERLKGDSIFMGLATDKNIGVLRFANVNLKKNLNFMLRAFPATKDKKDKDAFIEVCKDVGLTGNKIFMYALVQMDKTMFDHATDLLKTDDEMKKLVSH